jgi:FkbM family methyltransferase
MIKVLFNKDLNFKHKVITFATLNNKTFIVFFYNLYVKILAFLKIKNKSKFFYIKKITDKHFVINTEEGIINTVVVYRCLNLSSGLEWRINSLAKSYGVDYFKSVFKKKKPVVIDIGANIGEFSIFCAKRGSKVFSIEHDKSVFPMLKLNLDKFFPNSTTSFNLSISNKTGTQNIFYDTITGGTTLIQPIEKRFFNKKMDINKFPPEDINKFSLEDKVCDLTKSITLDDFIDENKIEFIDLIKCDAEGAEPEVIEGLKRNLAKVDYISIDTGPERNGEHTTDDVVALLKQKNFEIIKIPNAEHGRVVIARNKIFNTIK